LGLLLSNPGTGPDPGGASGPSADNSEPAGAEVDYVSVNRYEDWAVLNDATGREKLKVILELDGADDSWLYDDDDSRNEVRA
jgi:hypothetical protein